jgi:hypothetical protein
MATAPKPMTPMQRQIAAIRAAGNLSPAIADVSYRVMKGIAEPWYPSIYWGDREFQHSKAFGTSADTAGYEFFNANQANYTCDMPGNGAGLPRDWCFIYNGISFEVITGTDVNGAVDADGAQSQIASIALDGTAPAPYKTANEVANLLQHGEWSVLVADKAIDSGRGLHRAPPGSGVSIDASVAGTFTAGSGLAIAKVHNGAPMFTNRRLVKPQLILPGQTIRALVKFPSALALTSNGFITARLHGKLIRPA